ncbi:hypothetical protein NDU88_004921 [Pleurodeles waltl]|uniref:Uncharacterized protein n=1 Tax=Pleurodeles waltl TaxID=8319 RepID=A0AAV7LJK4_PLEWA|nr:hypothetical protein NDU88_004921 [Pleurodeles waltl]
MTTLPRCNYRRKLNRGQPRGRRTRVERLTISRGQPIQGDATLLLATQGPATAQLNMEIHGENQELDIEEIIKAAREAAATHSKDWILKQIRVDGASEVHAQEGPSDDRASVSTIDEEEPQNEAKKQQRNASRGAKKGDMKEASEHPEAGPSGLSK